MKDIRTWNDKLNWHGYQETYLVNRVKIRVTYNNGAIIGYGEYHSDINAVNSSTYYIK